VKLQEAEIDQLTLSDIVGTAGGVHKSSMAGWTDVSIVLGKILFLRLMQEKK
jgi:hypothetical protein